MQRPPQRRLTIPPTCHKLTLQPLQTRAPPYWQPPPQLLLHLPHLLHQLPISTQPCPRRTLALTDCVHRRREEQANGFIDVRFVCDGREREFGEGLGDADYGFELAHGDRDGAADVGRAFRLCDAVADGDEVGGEFF